MSSRGDAKQSFAEVRSQAELGNESSKSKGISRRLSQATEVVAVKSFRSIAVGN
jgi:hypothetical protein